MSPEMLKIISSITPHQTPDQHVHRLPYHPEEEEPRIWQTDPCVLPYHWDPQGYRHNGTRGHDAQPGVWEFISVACSEDPYRVHTESDDCESFYWSTLYVCAEKDYNRSTSYDDLADLKESLQRRSFCGAHEASYSNDAIAGSLKRQILVNESLDDDYLLYGYDPQETVVVTYMLKQMATALLPMTKGRRVQNAKDRANVDTMINIVQEALRGLDGGYDWLEETRIMRLAWK